MPGKGLNFEVLRVKFPWMNALHVLAWSEVTVAHEIPSVCMISNTPFLVISPPWLFPIIESFPRGNAPPCLFGGACLLELYKLISLCLLIKSMNVNFQIPMRQSFPSGFSFTYITLYKHRPMYESYTLVLSINFLSLRLRFRLVTLPLLLRR
jgi:hypothetical protein